MGARTIVWIILAVVVVVAVVAFVVVRSGARRAQAQREQATAIRAKAVALDRRLRKDEAERMPAEADSLSNHDQRRTGTA